MAMCVLECGACPRAVAIPALRLACLQPSPKSFATATSIGIQSASSSTPRFGTFKPKTIDTSRLWLTKLMKKSSHPVLCIDIT